MRTLKNNGLVTIPAAKTVKIDQGIKKSKNYKIWTERDFSSEVTFFLFLYNLHFNNNGFQYQKKI